MHHLTWYDYGKMLFCCKTYFDSLFTKYYANTLPKRYEWEPYLGENVQAILIHWHGPKYRFPDDCHVVFSQKSLHPDNVRLLALANLTETEVERLARNFFLFPTKHEENTRKSKVITNALQKRQLRNDLTNIFPQTHDGYRIETIRFYKYLIMLCHRNTEDLQNANHGNHHYNQTNFKMSENDNHNTNNYNYNKRNAISGAL
jgi:hypothetical protein